MSESLKVQFARRWTEWMDRYVAEGGRVAQLELDLNVSKATLYNWRKPETANTTLDQMDELAIYCGWDTEIDQRESVVNISDRGSNRCSDHTALYLREDSSVLVSV